MPFRLKTYPANQHGDSMSVWLCIPSARPPEEANQVLQLWRERGYKIALHFDSADDARDKIGDVRLIVAEYPGYSEATNRIIKTVSELDPKADWFVIGGDDVEPDLNHSAEEIARDCVGRFNHGHGPDFSMTYEGMRTWGVMQPTGDRWGDSKGAYADRVCGSAWLGREFCQRVNRGRGPLWPEYTHMFADEELQHVAQRAGILWQRQDLIQLHRHWGRKQTPTVADVPAHLKRWNTAEHWQHSRALFESRKSAGFPGSECK